MKLTANCIAIRSNWYIDRSNEQNRNITTSWQKRQFFTLTDRLLRRRESSPLPKCESQKELAQSFHIFFTDIIKCIRDQFERVHDLQLNTTALSSSKFAGFHEMCINEIKKILSNAPGTTCDLHPIPWALLKKCNDAVLLAITKIINT